MNVNLNCSVSLSKKLRKLIGNKGQITLVAELQDGRGSGSLVISADEDIVFDKDILGNETSIMLTPSKIAEYVPNSSEHGVETIFSSMPDKSDEPLTSKIAMTTPPDDTKKQNTQRKMAQKIVEEMTKKNVHVSSMEELMAKVSEAKKKIEKNPSKVDLNSITNVRLRAIEMEKVEIAEGIGVPAYIANDAVANLSINDLGISINMGDSYDLSRLSAKRIDNSADLRELMKAGMLHFISPDEALRRKAILLKKEIVQNRGLKAYSGVNAKDKAEAEFEESEDEVLEDVNYGKKRKSTAIDLTEDIGGEDEDKDFIDLVDNIGSKSPASTSNGKRVTSHSLSGNARSARPQSNNSTPKQHVSIKRLD